MGMQGARDAGPPAPLQPGEGQPAQLLVRLLALWPLGTDVGIWEHQGVGQRALPLSSPCPSCRLPTKQILLLPHTGDYCAAAP